jgi:hypothetical protein
VGPWPTDQEEKDLQRILVVSQGKCLKYHLELTVRFNWYSLSNLWRSTRYCVKMLITLDIFNQRK